MPTDAAQLDEHLAKLIQVYTLRGLPILVHCRGGRRPCRRHSVLLGHQAWAVWVDRDGAVPPSTGANAYTV